MWNLSLDGGSVFLWLKQQNPNARYIINDINDELIALYKNIQKDPQLFCDCVDIFEKGYLSLPNDKETRKRFYYGIRKGYWEIPETNILYTSSSSQLYFLMKTGFNGIWQTCTESHGRFGTPAGLLNQETQIYDKDLVFAWSRLLQNVEIRAGSFKTLDIPARSVVFCDPPYRDSFADYGTGFNDDSQKRLIESCKDWKQQDCKVFLANKEVGDQFFENLLPESKFHKFEITYTAGRRKKTEEGFEAKSATELLIEI